MVTNSLQRSNWRYQRFAGRPAALRICSPLNKVEHREVEVDVSWCGVEIPDEFVVGVGIDYARMYRQRPYIGKAVTYVE